jgi:hypothetical protein
MMRRPWPPPLAGTRFHSFWKPALTPLRKWTDRKKVLPQVRQRESDWIRSLFDHGDVACATKLSHLLAADSMH